MRGFYFFSKTFSFLRMKQLILLYQSLMKRLRLTFNIFELNLSKELLKNIKIFFIILFRKCFYMVSIWKFPDYTLHQSKNEWLQRLYIKTYYNRWFLKNAWICDSFVEYWMEKSILHTLLWNDHKIWTGWLLFMHQKCNL